MNIMKTKDQILKDFDTQGSNPLSTANNMFKAMLETLLDIRELQLKQVEILADHRKQLSLLRDTAVKAAQPVEKKEKKPEPRIEFQGSLVKQTEKAMLIKTDTGAVWFPKSKTRPAGEGRFSIPVWLASKLQSKDKEGEQDAPF